MGNSEVELNGASDVRQLVHELNTKFMVNIRITDDEVPFDRKPVKVIVNGRDVRSPMDKIKDGDYVVLFPIIDGG
ncbi:MAG: MoaD/ThiS family protein [Thermoplasmata archaeon]